jgi:hypothetical protein
MSRRKSCELPKIVWPQAIEWCRQSCDFRPAFVWRVPVQGFGSALAMMSRTFFGNTVFLPASNPLSERVDEP